MNHGSLFSGIGGFDLAAEWMGWENKFHCEWNPFGQKVLKHYWPEAESYTDITKTDFTLWRGKIDILTGGFPCQPYSQAGKRLGKEDDRHLWPEMLRAIREIQPRYVVGENVSGLINWNGGMVFNEVQAELEAEGYEVQPYVLPAAGVGAPHLRQRVWFVAFNDSDTNGFRCDNGSDHREERHFQNDIRATKKDQSERDGWKCGTGETGSISSYTDGSRWEKFNATTKSGKEKFDSRNALHANGSGIQGQYIGQEGERKFDRSNSRNGINQWENFPTQSPICDGNDGISSRLDGITFPKWRNESIKAGGNAIVPQVAFQIFQAIQEFQNNYGHKKNT